MTDTDRLAALLHEHWLEDPYVSDGAIFASCTCGEHVPIPAVTVENRDPVMAFSEHIAARLIAAGVTLDPTPPDALCPVHSDLCGPACTGRPTLPDALDVDRLEAAVFAAAFSAQDDVTEQWIGYEKVTKRIAREYAALAPTPPDALREAAQAFYLYHHADWHNCANDGPDWRDRCPVAALRAVLEPKP